MGEEERENVRKRWKEREGEKSGASKRKCANKREKGVKSTVSPCSPSHVKHKDLQLSSD